MNEKSSKYGVKVKNVRNMKDFHISTPLIRLIGLSDDENETQWNVVNENDVCSFAVQNRMTEQSEHSVEAFTASFQYGRLRDSEPLSRLDGCIYSYQVHHRLPNRLLK